jgi:hypothetical protein
MNRNSILTGLSLALVFFVASTQAQSDEPRTVANIPFEFSVGTLSFPAGQYQFQRTESGLVAVRDAGGNTQFTLAAASLQYNGIPGKSRLRFVTLQGRHVLTQVWNDQSASGYEFHHVQPLAEYANSNYPSKR